MKIYFGDPEYDGQFLRSIDYAPAGAQIGEAWTIAAQIQAGVECLLERDVAIVAIPETRGESIPKPATRPSSASAPRIFA